MIRWATSADIGRLRRLMTDCFGDTDEQTAAFMDGLFTPDTALCYTVDGEIASVLYLLPAVAYAGGRSHTAMYIYAAATDARFRGRGYMAALLNYAANNCGCDYLALAAADEGLIGYYARFGFVRALGLKEQHFAGTHGGELALSKADAEYVFSCRGAALERIGGVNWSRRLFDYAYSLYEADGMQWFRFESGYALVDSGAKKVVELCAVREDAALRAICSQFGWTECDYFSLSRPSPEFGMYKPLRDGLPPLTGIIGLCMQ